MNVHQIKQEICEIGRRIYNKGFAAANDGNISVRTGENEVFCSPTMVSKGFLKPEDLCIVDMEGNQKSGQRKRTSEIMLHLAMNGPAPSERQLDSLNKAEQGFSQAAEAAPAEPGASRAGKAQIRSNVDEAFSLGL